VNLEHLLKLLAVRLRRTTGNALALLNFPKGTLFNGASCSIFKANRIMVRSGYFV
jgi:hypothetical protein